MNELAAEVLPIEVQRRLKEFLDARKTGQLTLHIKEGQILKGNTNEFWDIVDKGVDSV